MCEHVANLSTSEQETYAFVNSTKTTFLLTLSDVDTCIGFLDAIENATNLPPLFVDSGPPNGFLCESVVGTLDATLRSDFATVLFKAGSLNELSKIIFCYILTDDPDTCLASYTSIPREIFVDSCSELLTPVFGIRDELDNTEGILNWVAATAMEFIPNWERFLTLMGDVYAVVLEDTLERLTIPPELFDYVINLLSVADDNPSANALCEAAATVGYNESTSVEDLVDDLLNVPFTELAQVAPILCQWRVSVNDSGLGRDGTEPLLIAILNELERIFVTPGFSGEGFPFLHPVEILSAIIAFLGQYDDTDSMCEHVANLSTSEQETYAFVNSTKTTFLLTLSDVDTCIGFLDAIENATNLPPLFVDSGPPNGFLCESVVGTLDATLRSDFATVLFRAGNLNELSKIIICYISTDDPDTCLNSTFVPRDLFVDSCLDLFTPVFGIRDELNNAGGFLNWVAATAMESISNWGRFLSLIEDVFNNVLSTTFTRTPELFNYVLNFIGVVSDDDHSADDLCEAAATVGYNESASVEEMVDDLFDVTFTELAHISPILCQWRVSVMGINSTESPLINFLTELERLFLTPGFSKEGLPILDPVEVLSGIITFLGQYEDTDSMCEHVAIFNTTGEATDVMLAEFVNRTKAIFYQSLRNADTCVALFEVIEEVSGVPNIFSSFGLTTSVCYSFVGIRNQLFETLEGFYRANSVQEVVQNVCYFATNDVNNAVCIVLSSISREMAVDSCVYLISPLFDDRATDWLSLWLELLDELRTSPFNEILQILDVRFGLKEINNGYHVCYAGIEFIIADQVEKLNFFQRSLESLIDFYLPFICEVGDRVNEMDGFFGMFVNLLTGIMSDSGIFIFPNRPDQLCQLLNASRSDSNILNITTSLSAAVISHATKMIEREDSCARLMNIVFPFLSNAMFLEINISPPMFCKKLVKAVSNEPDSDVPVSEFKKAIETPEVVSDAITFLNVLREMCIQFEDIMTVDDTPGLIRMCDAIRKRDLYDLSYACRQVMVPLLKHGEDHPVSLRDIPVGREFLKALLPLANYPVWEEPSTVCPATETLINSEVSLEFLVKKTLTHWLRIGIEVSAEICAELDKVYNYMKPHNYGSNSNVALNYDRRYNAIWNAVAKIFDFKNPGELCSATTRALTSRGFGEMDNLTDVMTKRIYDMGDDVMACTEGVNGVSNLLDVQIDFDGRDPTYVYTGYTTAHPFCVDFVDIMTGDPIRLVSKVRKAWKGGFVGFVDVKLPRDTLEGWSMVLKFTRKIFDFKILECEAVVDHISLNKKQVVVVNTDKSAFITAGTKLRIVFVVNVYKGIASTRGLRANVDFYPQRLF
ncbi:uncharacterized protein [Amphiura filiformis]|uniref:uncharacterized protein n=1 Tax=Amphiura filiformis TaxID=82378 RepID=UPI003B21271F